MRTASGGVVTAAYRVGRPAFARTGLDLRLLGGVVANAAPNATGRAQPYAGLDVERNLGRGLSVAAFYRGHGADVSTPASTTGTTGTGSGPGGGVGAPARTRSGWVSHVGARLIYGRAPRRGRIGWHVGVGPEYAWAHGGLPSSNGVGVMGEAGLALRLSHRVELRLLGVAHGADLDGMGDGWLWTAGGTVGVGVDL